MRYLRLRFAFLSPENVSALAVVAGSSRVLFHGHTNQIINGDLTKIKSQTPFERQHYSITASHAPKFEIDFLNKEHN